MVWASQFRPKCWGLGEILPNKAASFAAAGAAMCDAAGECKLTALLLPAC